VFQNFLKRKHEESEVTATYDAITEAQSTQAQAARANKELDEELRTLLRPLPVGKYTVWPDDFQKAWQANLFEPHHVPEVPETFDFGSLKNSYLAMKESNPWQKSYCRSYRAHNLISTPMRTEDSAGPLGAPQWATKAPLQETIALELRTVNGYSWD